MDTRLAIAFARRVDGQRLNVSALCAELQISRQTFYVYERRFGQEGLPGLLGRSRAPVARPNQTPESVEDMIESWHRKLSGDGLDSGARSVWARMRRAGQQPPSWRTVHRVLVRRGLVEPQPHKRPRSSLRRFVAAQPNGIWQIDGMEWKLADGAKQVIVRVLDDHSRKALASVVADQETAEAAWACLQQAIGRYGAPAMFLSDNSLAFNGSRKAREVLVERNLRAMGVAVVAASPHHPQTCGKAEREHQTMQKWLCAHPAADSPSELLQLIEIYDDIYNTQRPHQGLGDGTVTPHEAYAATQPAQPSEQPTATKPRTTQARVSGHGEVSAGWYRIGVGRAWAGTEVTVIRDGNSVAVFHGRDLIDSRPLDPNRRYQPQPATAGVLSAM